MSSRFDELLEEVRDVRTDLRALERRAGATDKKADDALKRAKAIGERAVATERQAAGTERRVAKNEREIGRAASDALRFAREIGQKLGRLGAIVESEGFQRFFARVDAGDELRVAELALGVAADAASGASRLGGIVPVYGAAVGGLLGTVVGSQRDALKREGLRRATEERDRAFLARQERNEEADRERRQLTGSAKAVAAIRDQQRQGEVGVVLVRKVEDTAAAMRRARAGAQR